MSVDVTREVRHHSESRGTDRCVMFTLADAASPDGVTWLPIEPPKRKPNNPNCITLGARCSKREAIRAIDALVGLGELEVRKAQRGRVRINVYRVCVGAIGATEVDYDRLPFDLDRPFGRGDDLAPREVEAGTAGAGEVLGTADPGRGDNLAPRQAAPANSDEVTGSDLTGCQSVIARGDISSDDEVTPSRAREDSAFGAEPSGPKHHSETAAESKEKPTSEQSYEETSLRSAAALAGEPASLLEIAQAVARFRSADINTLRVVEPLALLLPNPVFTDIVERALRRRARNDVGILVHLLRTAIAERRKLQLEQVAALVDQAEPRRIDPEAYVRRLVALPSQATPEQVRTFVERYVDDVAKLNRLVLLADELLHEPPRKQIERWIRECSLELTDLDVVHAQIDEFVDELVGADYVERAMLHDLAEEAREEAPALKVAEGRAA